MRLPWVARLAVDLLQERVRSLESALAAERDRYDRLVAKMGEMQRAGFVPPPPAVEAVAPKRPLTPKIEAAIADLMHPRGVHGRATAQRAREWLEAGADENEVLARIHAGAGG